MSMSMRIIGLCDCDNFFVSCERRCDPSLNSRPVVVLSGNDGCVISRSKEVKDMGIPMGAPYFKVRRQLEQAGAAVLSGRLSMYGEISAQVMERISRFTDLMEVYSIDEAFFNLSIASVADTEEYCRRLRADIMRCCGVPVSVGISCTKTLAKLASKCAKKSAAGVFRLRPEHYLDPEWMGRVSASDIWGVGRRTAERLRIYHRILSAYDLASADDLLLKKNFSVHTLYTAWELRGCPVYLISDKISPPRSIQVSRSFGEDVCSYEELLEALSCFVLRAACQLRRAGRAASRMEIWIMTSRFKKDNFYARSAEREFHEPCSVDSDFLYAARDMLSSIYRHGFAYKKAGVLLSELSDTACGIQMRLFDENRENTAGVPYDKLYAAAGVTDAINSRAGRTLIAPADNFAPGGRRRWHSLHEHGSAFSPVVSEAAEIPKRRIHF